jgi:hypothetical protein
MYWPFAEVTHHVEVLEAVELPVQLASPLLVPAS